MPVCVQRTGRKTGVTLKSAGSSCCDSTLENLFASSLNNSIVSFVFRHRFAFRNSSDTEQINPNKKRRYAHEPKRLWQKSEKT